jgi:hypothetical protein
MQNKQFQTPAITQLPNPSLGIFNYVPQPPNPFNFGPTIREVQSIEWMEAYKNKQKLI